jgi:predicted ribosomally synthesized peptide with SipW-like signal peptide
VRARRRLLGLIALGALAAATAGGVTWAAFTATSTNSGNQIQSGTVKLDDNDNGSAVLALSAAEPGASDSGCIEVTFNGSLASGVKLYGTTSGTGLDQYLELKVTRGTYSPTNPGFDSCTNFQPDATDYIGSGAGVVYDGTLQGYPDNYAGGVVDPPSGGAESWTNGESHVYKLEVSLRHNLAAQGLNATQQFTWEARSQ